jgi:phosphate transport system protein
MREVYHELLKSVGRDLATMADLVAAAMREATVALLEADSERAQEVIGGDEAVNRLHSELDARAVDLIARQQPVAGDLRTLVASLRMSADLERMGDLAVHLAEIARRRHPEKAIPSELSSTIAGMAAVGIDLAEKVARIIRGLDLETARTLAGEDDEVDRLHRELLTALITSGERYSAETAIDVALAGRYYERFADHAVSIAKRLEFIVTGTTPAAIGQV